MLSLAAGGAGLFDAAGMDMVFDKGTVFEMGRMGAADHRACAARWLAGRSLRATRYLGGSWDAKTSEKAERFVKLADQFRLPIVHLVDNPGFMIGREAETAGTIRYGVQAMNAVYKASVPLASVVLRRAYGIAGSAMSNAETYQYRYCWPSGDWGSLPIAGGWRLPTNRTSRRQRSGAELEPSAQAASHQPLSQRRALNVEDIDPRDTRPCCANSPGWHGGFWGEAPPVFRSHMRCGPASFAQAEQLARSENITSRD